MDAATTTTSTETGSNDQDNLEDKNAAHPVGLVNGKASNRSAVTVIISQAENGDNNSSCDEEEEEKHLTSSITTSSSKKTAGGKRHGGGGRRKRTGKELPNLAPTASTKTMSSVTYQRPPDGGWGWWVVLASFMINFICDGVSFSSGIFFVQLVETLKETKSKTAWVSSVFLAIPLIAGPVASALTDHFGCRRMAIFGSVLTATGFILSSLVTTEEGKNGIEYLLVTFSISGLGMAFCYVTAIVSVAYYFEKRRSLATGLAVCGSGFGTMLLPYFFNSILRVINYQQTFVVVAFIFLTIVGFGFLIRDLDIDAFIMSREGSSNSSSNDSDDDDDDEEDDEDSDDEDENDSDGDTSDLGSNSALQSEGLSPPTSPTFFSRLKQTSERSLSNKIVDEPTTSRSSGRKRHVSENIDSSEKLARTSTSLINIPTYLQNGQLASSVPSTGADIEAGGHQFTEMFRHGGHLNNLIKCYPHLLDFFLPALDKSAQNEPVDGKSTTRALSTHERDDAAAPVSSAAGKGEEDRRVVEFNLPDEEEVLESSDDLHYRRDSINVNSVSSPNIGVVLNGTSGKVGNGHHTANEGKELLRKSTGQLYNFCSATGRGRHLTELTTHRQLSELGGGNTLHKLRLQRGSLTYRGAMLVIGSKYRLKASSAPDIYRTSMATINGENKRYTIFENIKEIVWDMIDLSSFKSFRYSLFCLSNFLLYMSVDVPYVHLPDHVSEKGAATGDQVSWLISIIGIFNTLGIVFVGYIGDKPWLDASFVYTLFIVLSGLAMGAIPLCGTNYFLIALLSGVYGFTISANYSLVSIILVELISLDAFTNAYGMLLLVQGLGSLVGPPIAGYLFDVYGNYDNALITLGLLMAFSGLLVAPLCRKENCFLWPEGRRRRSMSKSNGAAHRRANSSSTTTVSRSSSSESFHSKKSATSVSLLFSNVPLDGAVNGSNLKPSLRHPKNGTSAINNNNKHSPRGGLNVIVEDRNEPTAVSNGCPKADEIIHEPNGLSVVVVVDDKKKKKKQQE